MAKKFGKLLMVTAALGAVAGGVYYYLKGRDTLMDDDFDDDEDFDNFDDDLDESEADRNYVDLDLGKTEESSAKDELKEEFSFACRFLPVLLYALLYPCRTLYPFQYRGNKCQSFLSHLSILLPTDTPQYPLPTPAFVSAGKFLPGLPGHHHKLQSS